MKVALLECDHVAERLLHIGGHYRDMFQALFSKLEFTVYNIVENEFPASVADHEIYIVTGSKYSVYDDIPWIYKLKSFVREIQLHHKYFIGVCFGHQLLAEALDGEVVKNEIGWCVGVHSFQVVHREKWMIPPMENLRLLMSCQDTVRRMPRNSTLLARSEDCAVGMFVVGDRMIGIQGHPEFSKEYDRALMKERVRKIGGEKVKKGIDSLKMDLDADIFAKWMMEFLRMSPA